MRFDVLIRGGMVVDGTGAPPFRADLGLLDTTIADVGRLPEATAERVIDANGLYVAPGFIDAHVHGDLALLADPVHRPALMQGVTTYVIGQDGSAFAPASPKTMDYMRRYTAGFNADPDGIAHDWNTVAEYLARFDRTTALNVAYLIPNGNVRMEVMGLETRPPTDQELRAMRQLVREGMEAGAVGLSSGLDYIPSRYADAREIAALCEEIAPFDGVYVSHIRGYGPKAPEGVAEIVEVAQRSGAAVHISHYNGPSATLLPLVDRARASGVDLTYDTYPYLVGSTILGMVALPAWVQEGGIEPTVERLGDPEIRRRLHEEWFSGDLPYALDTITLTMVKNPEERWAEGMNLVDAARRAGVGAGRLCLRPAATLRDGRRDLRGPRRRPDRRGHPGDSSAPGAHGRFRRHFWRQPSPPEGLGGLRALPRPPYPRAGRLRLGQRRWSTSPATRPDATG